MNDGFPPRPSARDPVRTARGLHVIRPKILEAMPTLRAIARLSRRFLIDAVPDLAAERGIRQFLDISGPVREPEAILSAAKKRGSPCPLSGAPPHPEGNGWVPE